MKLKLSRCALIRVILGLASMGMMSGAFAEESPEGMTAADRASEHAFCVWDPIGRGGGITRIAKSLQPELLKKGVSIRVTSYVEEKVAQAAFMDNQCDFALLPANVIYDQHPFVTSLSAVGAIRTLEELDLLLATLSAPKAGPLMSGKSTEVAGLLPSGGIFSFLRNRDAYRMEDLQGKKFAVMSYDPISAEMIRKIGGSPVGTTLFSFAGLFNSGSVDVAYAPAIAYGPMELEKGLANNGGIVRYPWLQGFLALVIRPAVLPEDLGQHLRTLVGKYRPQAMALIEAAEAAIPPEKWIDLTVEDQRALDVELAKTRGELKERGIYDEKALAVMKKVRCHVDGTRGECSAESW